MLDDTAVGWLPVERYDLVEAGERRNLVVTHRRTQAGHHRRDEVRVVHEVERAVLHLLLDEAEVEDGADLSRQLTVLGQQDLQQLLDREGEGVGEWEAGEAASTVLGQQDLQQLLDREGEGGGEWEAGEAASTVLGQQDLQQLLDREGEGGGEWEAGGGGQPAPCWGSRISSSFWAGRESEGVGGRRAGGGGRGKAGQDRQDSATGAH